jgi:D-alanine-D-alanine ligase
MKISIVYNRESHRVINVFGVPSREKYGLGTINNIAKSLRKKGHTVKAMEGDKELIFKLEDFMPRVLKGELPGMVFNISYGIQGQARYTHVPSILEMVGIPYVGSGPLAHSLALDKVVSKMIFRQNDLLTPNFAVIQNVDFVLPELKYPLIIKPKNEAVSFGIRLVRNKLQLREGVKEILHKFHQSVLVEEYIEGLEINVGLLGNSPCEAFLPAEVVFDGKKPKIYTQEDKQHKSGRDIKIVCPANISKELTARSQKIAKRAFTALGCCDCARVDMRIDSKDKIYLLEINSLPSLGLGGSYVKAAHKAGLDFCALVNRLVEVASARYFGTPSPPMFSKTQITLEKQIFKFLTERRDRIKKRLERWVHLTSRTNDMLRIREASAEIGKSLESLNLTLHPDFSDERYVWSWQTKAGLDNGTLLIVQLDIPLDENFPAQSFRREPEWLYGEGIGCSRGPAIMTYFSFLALHNARQLHNKRIGALLYADEGLNCQYSSKLIRETTSKAARVLVLRPGNVQDSIVVDRRGERVYHLTVEDVPRRLTKSSRNQDLLNWTNACLARFSRLGATKRRLSVCTVALNTAAFPMKLPHRVTAKILVTYSSTRAANTVQEQMKKLLKKGGFSHELEMVSERPPMLRRRINSALIQELENIAQQWEIPLQQQSSSWPSAAGLVPKSVPVVCGVGPVGRGIYTPHESISRISLAQRTLLLAQFLGAQN